MIFQTKAKLIKNIAVTPKCYKILLLCPQIAKNANPGQFVEIKISDGFEPFLRRPLSIHNVVSQFPPEADQPLAEAGKPVSRYAAIEILYRVIGKGTKLLSEKKPGELLDIIGPLGNSFNLSTTHYPLSAILVAGGIGVAPLFFLAEKLKQDYPLSAIRYPLVLIGAKTENEVFCKKEFEKIGCDVKIATDDGSRGFKGRVMDLLGNILRATHDAQRTTIYSCGPRPMLKEISRISKEYNIPAQISLEEHMACGIGACLGCVVETKQGYKRVCKEGPVFDADEIIWE